jgi:hypothetical protein
MTKQLCLMVFAGTFLLSAQIIPNNARSNCPVAPATFNSWFEKGAPSLDGVVKPANSVTFPSIPNCSFYEWSKQMFLWLTSPAPDTYGGGGGRIFDSPAFYDVSPEDSNHQRTFIAHTPGFVRFMALRVPQHGPHGLPVIFDRKGRMIEVVQPRVTPSGKQLVQD